MVYWTNIGRVKAGLVVSRPPAITLFHNRLSVVRYGFDQFFSIFYGLF